MWGIKALKFQVVAFRLRTIWCQSPCTPLIATLPLLRRLNPRTKGWGCVPYSLMLSGTDKRIMGIWKMATVVFFSCAVPSGKVEAPWAAGDSHKEGRQRPKGGRKSSAGYLSSCGLNCQNHWPRGLKEPKRTWEHPQPTQGKQQGLSLIDHHHPWAIILEERNLNLSPYLSNRVIVASIWKAH